MSKICNLNIEKIKKAAAREAAEVGLKDSINVSNQQ